jgi:hypothetical protein
MRSMRWLSSGCGFSPGRVFAAWCGHHPWLTKHSFEVDVFGNPSRVTALGSHGLITDDSHGRYVSIPGTCTPGIADAERWRGNVRFVVRYANPAHSQLLSTGARALANL